MTNRPPLQSLLSDRLLWLLALTAALAAVLGFYAINGEPAIRFVSKTGFWFVLAAFALFVRALWLALGDSARAWRPRDTDWASVAIVALGGTVLLVHESYGFKIVMDEIMLLGTSMAMHFDKTVLTPMRGNDIQGVFVILDGIMDKRPLFFPFLVSLLHDVTGYRPANVFLLNSALTFLFLGLVCAAGRALAGRVAGWIGVALLAGLPLLAQNATGGGFELLNLVMILGTLLLAARHLARRDAASLAALVLAAVLMVQVRYETVLFALPVALVIGWVALADRRLPLTWPVVVAPLLLVPYPLQHRIFELRASAWELGSQPAATSVFSPGYVLENLAHAANFFFASPKDQPSSLTLSVLGWLAVPFALLTVAKKLRALDRESPVFAATVVFFAGFVAQFALMMFYFWGRFDDPVIRRLSLPTHLWLVLSVLLVLPGLARAAVQQAVFAVAVLALIVSGAPSMAAHAYSQEYLPGREIAWRRQFIADQPRHDYLVIDNDAVFWVAHQISATPVLQARKRRADVVFHFRNRTFSGLYVFQRFNIDPATGRLTLRDGDDLGPDYVLEPVREERLQTLTLTRLSRVIEIREGAQSLTTPDPALATVPKSRAEIERLRQAYLENFVKMLP